MPDPAKYDNQDDFVSACISTRHDEHPEEDNAQSVAICISQWKEKSMKTKQDEGDDIEPGDDESQSDFMARCTAAGNDQDECAELWDEFMEEKSASKVIHKTHITPEVQNLEFILSDETVDRYGDVIMASGWVLDDFKKNPIALFNHNADFPVGRWKNLGVRNGSLRGHLELAPAGTSPRLDEIRKLIDAGILRATSVGFIPIAHEPTTKGHKYTKSSLCECSVVSVPANPNTLAIARSLKVSDDTLKIVFGENADKKMNFKSRGLNGKHAETKPIPQRNRTMSSPIAQRVIDTEQRIVKLTDQLNEHLKAVDDENPTEEQTTVTQELTTKIEQEQKTRDMLRKAEVQLAAASKPPAERPDSTQTMEIRNVRPFAVPAKKIKPVDYIWRALTVKLKHHAEQGNRSLVDVLKSTYGEDEGTYALMGMITRATTTPARTDVSGWAQELVTVAIGEFFGLLQPVSIYAALSQMGGRFTFGPNGIITIPTRASTPTVGGAFIAQGGVIPVKKAGFAAISLTPKKVGVISTFTREIAEHSTPSIEQLVRDAIVEDTATAIDAVLMDNNAATTTRPAGLGNGVSTQTPAGGADLAAVIADLKTMSNALAAGSNGNIRNPVWIMTPGAANCIALSQIASVGVLPFREEVAAGRLNGWPIIRSTSTLPADTIWLIDAADFITATTDTPRFDVSDQAVLHLEDTTPLDITTAAVGTSVKSLWQTDSIGVRMLMDINWAMRRQGMVYFMTGINWSP